MNVDDRLATILDAERRIRMLVDQGGLNGDGGGGTSGGMTDDWKAGVDAQLSQLHADVRRLLIGLIAGFLFLLAAGAGAYVKINDQVNASAVSLAELRGKADLLNAKLDLLVERSKTAR